MSDSDDEAAELRAVNARMQELAEGLEYYADAIRERNPGVTEPLAFQGWVIQEIASLQVAVERVAAEVARRA